MQLRRRGRARRRRPLGASTDSQWRKRLSAAPSRAWAARWPAISASFLIALGSTDGIALLDDLRARLSRAPRRSPPPRARDRRRRSCRRGARRCGSNACALVDADAVAEMLADVVADLLRGDEQIGGAVVMDQREGQRDRRMLDVLAADVEGPGDRIERGEHRRVGLLLVQPVGHLLPLGGRGLAGEARRDGRPAAPSTARACRPRPRRSGCAGRRPARRPSRPAPRCARATQSLVCSQGS